MKLMSKGCTENLWCFLAVYLSCSILHSMRGPFLSSGIQSIERQFQIPSSKSGTLISASRIGYIPTVLIFAYIGSKGNRARWIGCGSIIVACGCILAALPNFIFPPKSEFSGTFDSKFILNSLIQPNSNSTKLKNILDNPVVGSLIPLSIRTVIQEHEEDDEFDEILNEALVTHYGNQRKIKIPISGFQNNTINSRHKLVENLAGSFSLNVTLSLMKQAEFPFGYCNSTVMRLKYAVKNESCRKRKSDLAANQVAYGMVFLAIVLFGIGQSLSGTLGTPLIDDSVSRKNAPFYFAALRSIRVLGPISGAWMAAGCFKLYVTLKAPPPGMSPTDPRWIGAWWLGFLIVGSLLFVPAILMFNFPNVQFRRKKRKSEKVDKESNEKLLLAGVDDKIELSKEDHVKFNFQSKGRLFVNEVNMFCNSIFLCLKSPVYVGILMGRLFDSFAFRGLSSFQSKFIENHYGIPQHQISFFNGVVGALSYAGGIMLGSVIMRKFKLDGRRAATYTMLCSFLSVVLTVSKVSLKCQSINNAVGNLASELDFNLTSLCNQNCLCDKSNLYPVCDKDGTPFFSPCHAGCTNFTLNLEDSEATTFSNCECVNGKDVSRSYCNSDCTVALYMYYSISVLTGIIAGTSGIPNMLISLRSVPHEVRSVAMAFSGFLVSLLSAAPSPILVGKIIDTACILWNNVCGRQGACLLYDANALRIRIHTMYGILRATGLLFDIWVWYWAAHLVLLQEPSGDKKTRKLSNIPINEKE